jgi:enoyl-CoA hydratase/carnithine racemase
MADEVLYERDGPVARITMNRPGVWGHHKRSWDCNVDNTLRWRDLPKSTLAAVHGLCEPAGNDEDGHGHCHGRSMST